MRIQHNIGALNAHRNLGGNNTAVGKNLEKLSSGYRINRAADDAAGLAISEKMRAQIKGLEKAQDNANDGISMIQTAEGALTEVHSMLNRMTELATQGANGTYQSADVTKIQSEMTALNNEIDRIIKNTKFNGIGLLDGKMDNKNLQIGPTAAEALKLTGMTDLAGNADITKVKGLDFKDNDSAQKGIADIEKAINTVSERRSNLGAVQNRLEHTVNNLGVTTENMTAAESRIRDVDMAKEMMNFTKNNILTQAAQSMLAQANQTPQGVLQLLQ